MRECDWPFSYKVKVQIMRVKRVAIFLEKKKKDQLDI